MPAEEKKSSWKFQSDDRRWGVEKMVPCFAPPYPSRSKTISGFHKYFSVLLCLCVCVCVVLQPEQKLPCCKTALQIFKSDSITKMTWNADKPWNKWNPTRLDSTRVYTQLGSTEPNWTENRKQEGEERKENREQHGKGQDTVKFCSFSSSCDAFAFWCTNSMTFSQLIVVITLLQIPCKYPTYVLMSWDNGWVRVYTFLSLLSWVNLFNLLFSRLWAWYLKFDILILCVCFA